MEKRKKRSRLCATAAAVAAAFVLPAHAGPGDPLGPVLTVATATPPDRMVGVAVARAADGHAAVAWSSGIGIFVRLLDAAGAPSGPDRLVDPRPTSARLEVAMNAGGAFVVGWARGFVFEGDRGVYVRRYAADGTPQGDVVEVAGGFDNGRGDLYLGNAAIAIDDDGDFVVAWPQGRIENQHTCLYGISVCIGVGGYSVRLRRYGGGGTQAAGVQTVDASATVDLLKGVNVSLGSDQRNVDAAMAPDGRFVVTWARAGDGLNLGGGVYARRYDAEGHGELKRTVSLQLQDGPTPAVAMSASGAYAVVYDRHLRDTATGVYSGGLFMRQFPASAGLGAAEQRVDDGSDSVIAAQDVAMDAAGDSVVSWAGSGGTGNGRGRAQRYADGGGALGINFTLDGTYVRAAMTPAGDFAFAWNDNGNAIRSRFYDGP
ncbi:MAG: hypothetical protein ACREVL_10650 [Solimonas sp.]